LSTTTLESPPAERPPEPPRGSPGFLLAALALAALALFGLSLWLYLSQRPPGDDSAEAGFARDMIVHHAQAVQMAGIVRDKTEDDSIRTLATDIALTQQGQIGQMQGWLAVWGLPQTGNGPAMSWMGHPHEGPMPGMATQGEINELRDAPPDEADALFLRLMIEHHRAALPMAEAILKRTNRPAVEQLAGAIATSQAGEIRAMEDMLRKMGANPPESTGQHDHSHGGSASNPTPDGGTMKLDLAPTNGSGASGTATFADTARGVEVRLQLEGLPEPGTTYLAHIHPGTCVGEGGNHPHEHGDHGESAGGQDEIEYPLDPVEAGSGSGGSSETVLEGLTVEQLSSGEPMYVNVHAEATGSEETPPSIACANL
jgi:uncharacterized protein (DUF305 family)